MAADVADRIAALQSSTASLLRSTADLTDADARGPSLLPGWTRGHVLTHIARNADAMVNLVTWARTGVETRMYPSREERRARIEEGSGRPAAELVADVTESSERLTAALSELSGAAWEAPIRWGGADKEGVGGDIPVIRRIEVEVHHVDLDLDYTVAHWPEDLVESLLTDATADFTRRNGVTGFVLVGNEDEGRWQVGDGGQVITGPPPALLGWLLGRTDGTGLHSDERLPEMEVWR